MKISVLDGSPPNDQMVPRILAQLSPYDVEHFILRELKIAPCAGNFLCWTKTPGICKNNDDNRLIAKAMIQSDLLLLLTPLTFGGYSSELKKGLDHLIQNVSPFFTTIEGETHHKKRYKKYPNLCVLGWTERQDLQAEQTFKHLVGRNAINFNSEQVTCELLYSTHRDDELSKIIRGALNGDENQLTPDLPKPLEARNTPDSKPLGKAVLLVGSPRKTQSTSYSLGMYLCSKLEEQGVATETIFLYGHQRDEESNRLLCSTIDHAHAVLLAFPLYVDTLPSPVIEFLEQLATYKSKHTRNENIPVVALLNCGFPEASHIDNALAILAQFCKETGFVWGGGIALGNGDGLGAKPLEARGSFTRGIRKALDLAATALSHGEAIPKKAIELAAKPQYPPLLFRFGALFFWKKRAARYGVKKGVHARPYAGK